MTDDSTVDETAATMAAWMVDRSAVRSDLSSADPSVVSMDSVWVVALDLLSAAMSVEYLVLLTELRKDPLMVSCWVH